MFSHKQAKKVRQWKQGTGADKERKEMPHGSRKEADSQTVKERQISRDKAKIAGGDPDDFLIPRMRSHLAWQFPFP